MNDEVGRMDQTYTTESPRYIERTLLVYHLFQEVVCGLELDESRNVIVTEVSLLGIDFTDAGGWLAFQRTVEEMVFPMWW